MRLKSLPAILLAAILAGCSAGHPKAPARTTLPTLSSPAPTSTAAPGPTTSTPPAPLAWSACAGHAGWDCATLQVPLDHDHPGRTIGIALSRHRAKAGSRKGSLLVNPGGPGDSGITFGYSAVELIFDRKLVDAFDIIAFDPRGVGQSTPVHCTDGPALDRYLHIEPNPTTPQQLAAVVDATKEFTAACGARSGDLLKFVSTTDAARDMEDIRVAVGDPNITYLGFSYGTYLGATYAELFPNHIRAMALDGALDPTLDGGQSALAQAAAFEHNLNAFLADCSANQSTCAFKAHGAASLRAAFDALAARIDAQPIPVGSRSLGPGEALFGIALPLYDRTTWPILAQSLADAQAGNGATLLKVFDQYAQRTPDGHFSNLLESNNAVNCLDHPGPASLEQFKALATSATKVAPYFGGPLAWSGLACLYWPVAPTRHPGPISAPGAPPIVVVGSTDDPATPYDGAVHLAAGFGPSAVLVTRHGEGHTGYLSSDCVRADIDSYLIDLTPPANRDCASSP